MESSDATKPAVNPASLDELLYQEARQELRAPKPPRLTGLVFIVLFLLFLGGQFTTLKSLTGIVVLVAVVIFHEAGHAVGMRLFGFRDVRMFFIPFFGAAVSGRPRGVAAWKEALVSLLGPLPGILLGTVLVFAVQPSALLVTVLQALLFLNAFNLLPLGFLDGGRFFERILFSRHPVLAIAAQALGSLSLVILGVAGSMWILAIFAGFGLLLLRVRWRVLKSAAAIRAQYPALNPDPDHLGEEEGRAVFAAARRMVERSPASATQPTPVANFMEQILDATKPAPSAGAAFGLFVLYGFGLLCATVGIFRLSVDMGSASWRTFEQPGWQVEFPQQPLALGPDAKDEGVSYFWRAAVGGTDRFSVSLDTQGGAREGWMDEAARELVRSTGLPLVDSKPVEVSGRPGREFHFAGRGREARARMIAVGSRRFQLVTSAPVMGENHTRFLDSFALREAPAGTGAPDRPAGN